MKQLCRIQLGLFFLILLIVQGCGGGPERTTHPAGYPVGFVERGVASWYGPGFHGNKTANGEQYDMHQLTAAHRTLPLGSVVQVRSLTNDRAVTVRVNDRGPFAKGRILDLSLAAAQKLGMTGAGTDRIELRVIGYQGRPGAMGYLRVQVASFVDLANAKSLATRLKSHYPDVRLMTVDLPAGRRSPPRARPRRWPGAWRPSLRWIRWFCETIPRSPSAPSFNSIMNVTHCVCLYI
jgi:rare lipoprotein A